MAVHAPMTQDDTLAMLDLLTRGEKVPAISEELGINQSILRARIAEIQKTQGVLLQYRAIQSLQLTSLQARILEAITPDKINSAPLRDLVMSYKILKDKEQVIEGKPSEIKGLVAHLIYLEKQERALAPGEAQSSNEDAQDAVFTDEIPAPSEDMVQAPPPDMFAQLAELDDQAF